MARESLVAQMQEYVWLQKWEIEPGLFTPGQADVELLLQRLGLPEDMTGLSVLDIGAFDGAISFVCERRNAARVVAQDVQMRSTIRLLRDYLGSKIEFFESSPYELDPAVIGQFDIVIFSGVLYHMRYPLLAIDRVREVAKDRVFVETHVANINLSNPPPGFENVMFFYERDAINNDYSNWHGPTVSTVMAMFRSAGFSIEHRAQWGDRAGFHARVVPGPRPFLADDYIGHVAYHGVIELTPDEIAAQLPRRLKW
ncbi:MAG: class I SAM-dependent methyltransferase [Vulcanimicrobiaceae bacterium]